MQAYFNLGVALAETGKPQEAIQAYKRTPIIPPTKPNNPDSIRKMRRMSLF